MSNKISGKVWELDLDPVEKLVLLALADHADHEGNNVRPGNALLCAKTGLSERTIGKKIEKFIEQGILDPVNVETGRGNLREFSLSTDRIPRHEYFIKKEALKAERGSTFRRPKKAERGSTFQKKKTERGSTFMETESPKELRPLEIKRSNLAQQKVEPGAEKVEPGANSHDKDRARVLNRHEPSPETSKARAHGSPREPFNPQPEPPVTADLTPKLSPLEFALCKAVRWLPDTLNSTQWDQLVRASEQLSRHPDATPDRVLHAPAFYQSQRKFNFAVEWIANDWGLISAWIDAQSVQTTTAADNSRTAQRQRASAEAREIILGGGKKR